MRGFKGYSREEFHGRTLGTLSGYSEYSEYSQGGLAMPVALAETAYSETSALPVETGFSK